DIRLIWIPALINYLIHIPFTHIICLTFQQDHNHHTSAAPPFSSPVFDFTRLQCTTENNPPKVFFPTITASIYAVTLAHAGSIISLQRILKYVTIAKYAANDVIMRTYRSSNGLSGMKPKIIHTSTERMSIEWIK